MLNFFKKYTIIFLSALLLALSSCESRIGSCTDDPGEGSISASAKPSNIFSNNSQDLWQTQLADWQETPYYTNGQDITVAIGTGSYGSVDAHRGQSGRVTHPCNICSKIVKYASNGKIEYQTPNCICGPKIYGSPNQLTQSFQYNPNGREQFRAIETIQPQCEIMPGYLEQAHYGIVEQSERVKCEKSATSKIISIQDKNVVSQVPSNPINLSSQDYTCIPMEWALNLGSGHPNFTRNSSIQSFLHNNSILSDSSGIEKYYSKATYLLTADFKDIVADVDGSQQSGYEIVHFPVDYYEKELSQTESDKAKITQLKDVNYHQVNNCNASNGLSLYLGLFPPNSDMPGYNNKIYAYHLYSFNQICRSYYGGICNNAVTEFKLKSAPASGATAASGPEVLPKFFSANNGSIPAGYKIKFKVYDNYYTDNNSSDGYFINITSGIQTQNTDNQHQDEGIIGNVKNKIDGIFIGSQSYNFQASHINYASLFFSSAYASDTPQTEQEKIDEIMESAKKSGLIRATYENFTRKNQLFIRLVMSLFLLFYAVSYLMGLSEMNQKELVVRVFKIAIVFAFLDPALVGIVKGDNGQYTAPPDGYDSSDYSYSSKDYATLGFLLYQKYVVNFVLDGLNTLINIVSGFCKTVMDSFTANDGANALQIEGISFSQNVNFAYFDKILESIFNIKTVGSIISAFFTKLVVGALLLVVFLYFLVKTIFKLLITYILNWLQIILALSLGPIFFLFLLFSRTKSFFTKWLAFIFARGLDIVILLALTFPFLSVIYNDLLQLIGQPACLRAIGPSFLRIGVWFQGDSVNDDLNNFFGYMFVLARDIALVYMVNLIASYAPKISGKIINIAEQQNRAEMSTGATKIASITTSEALKAMAYSFKFANQSYVGGMTKSYLKQGALGASDFIGATRFAKFAKNTAVNTAQQAFKGFTDVVNTKNAKTAGTKIFDTAFGTNFSKQRGDTFADVAGATGGGAARDAAAGVPTAGVPTAGVPAGGATATGAPGGDPAGVPAAGTHATDATDGGAPAGGATATVTGGATATGAPAGVPAGGATATVATGGGDADKLILYNKKIQELSLEKQQGAGGGLGLDEEDSTIKDRLNLLKSKSRHIFQELSRDQILSSDQKKQLIENLKQRITDLAKESLETHEELNKLKSGGQEKMKEFLGMQSLPGGARISSGGRFGPPKPDTAEPANDQFKPAFLDKIKSTVQDGLESLQKTISNDLSLNKVLDLFIESQNEKLIYLNSQFGQSGEESNIEKELQKAFEKFKQDFTSTKTEFFQSQTKQITQYQQEAEQLKTDIKSNELKPEQKEKLIALATQNNQQDLAKKLEEQPTKLEKSQQEKLIKLVEQDSFAKQESQLVPKITKAIIANDNQPISDEIKQQVFKRVADELKPTTAIQETTKQEVLTKFVTQLDKETPDYAIIEPSIKQLKQELQTTNSATAKQQILVQFLAKKDIPQQAKDAVLQILESTETKDSLQQQARQDFINEVKIATLTTQLQDTKSTLEQQQILVQFLANRTNSSIAAEVETVLQKIKKEEETKSPPEQERTDFVRKIEAQSDAIKIFAQYHNPEPKSDEFSQEEKEILQKSKLFKDPDIEYLIENNEKYDEILKNAPLYDNEDYIKQNLAKISDQDQQNLQEYLEKREELLEKLLKTDWQVDLSTSVESIETQKKTFDAVLKLLGVKYKSDRDKFLSIVFAAQDTSLSMTDQIEKMYVHLEKPLDKMRRHDELLERVLVAINDAITEELQSQKNMQENAMTKKKKEQIEKNQLTIKKLQVRRRSFKSLFARIAHVVAKS